MTTPECKIMGWVNCQSKMMCEDFWSSIMGSICHARNEVTQITSSWGQHWAHLCPVRPRWAPCWPHEPCYQGNVWPAVRNCSFTNSNFLTMFIPFWLVAWEKNAKIKPMSSSPLQPIHYSQYFTTQIARFMGQTWGPSGADRSQVGPILAPWTLLSGLVTSTLLLEMLNSDMQIHNWAIKISLYMFPFVFQNPHMGKVDNFLTYMWTIVVPLLSAHELCTVVVNTFYINSCIIVYLTYLIYFQYFILLLLYSTWLYYSLWVPWDMFHSCNAIVRSSW